MGEREKLNVAVGKRTLELSNLETVMYPESRLVKAEVIAYYHEIAPVMLRHIEGRPLSLIRYPDGIDGESFFQKNAPDWTPAWVKTGQPGGEKKNYIIPEERATLVWLANQAALEIHIMNVREPHLDRPDQLVFDLDPPEDRPFTKTVELGLILRDFLADFGYHPFVKTSGKKGLHVVVPLEQKASVELCYDAAKSLARQFVRKTPETTLTLSKKRRQGKTLIDVVRNAPGQTTIAPYSLRATPRASVSCPVSWEELGALAHADALDLDAVLERLNTQGDPWDPIRAFAAPLHSTPLHTVIHPSRSLKEYERRRNFDRTREPVAGSGKEQDHRFVLHRHHASRLHYDLRLEEEGVLRSWAVPRGLPPRPGIKRLAVQTEDHPVEYLDFEGAIPEGEYGGGRMWIFSRGRYQTVKRKPTSLYLNIHADGLRGDYRLFKTGETQWIVERLDQPVPDLLTSRIDPMAPCPTDVIPEGPDFQYELKWDGFRAVVVIDEGKTRITTRNGLDVTDRFPELCDVDTLNASSAVLDGEIVCLDSDGLPDFETVVRRINITGRKQIEKAAKSSPAYGILFDCLYLDGRSILNEPLYRRREWLEDLFRSPGPYTATDMYEEPYGLWDSVVELNLEGIVSKKRNSPYRFGPSGLWLKTRRHQTDEFAIIGYTEGKGARRASLGALHLAEYTGDRLIYRGKVGTGLSGRQLDVIRDTLRKAPPLDIEIAGLPNAAGETTWIRPKHIVEVAYAAMTPRGRLRKPVFIRLRPDMNFSEYVEKKQKQSI